MDIGPPWRDARGVHYDDFRIRAEFVEDVRHRYQQRYRCDYHYQQRNDHPGNADEHEKRLALTGD